MSRSTFVPRGSSGAYLPLKLLNVCSTTALERLVAEAERGHDLIRDLAEAEGVRLAHHPRRRIDAQRLVQPQALGLFEHPHEDILRDRAVGPSVPSQADRLTPAVGGDDVLAVN